MLWDDKITCLVESTTYCNAKCPQCSRTNSDGLGFSEICKLKHVTLDEWISSYGRSYESIKTFHFSGQWGDCFMNPEIEDIFTHIRENSECEISFSTNGSLRDEEFFWRIGVDNRKRIIGTFDVDGWTQENHEMYRRNTNLNKVKENAESFAATTNPTKIFTVIFKHNQDDVKRIREWSRSIGAEFEPLQSNRFRWGSTDSYVYKGKEYILEQTTDSEHLDNFDNGRKILDHRHQNKISNNIECSWGLKSKIYVDEYQNVWPCCYWHIRTTHPSWEEDNSPFHVYNADVEKGDYNLKNHTLKTIMNNKFYKRGLVKSFEINPSKTCQWFCGV